MAPSFSVLPVFLLAFVSTATAQTGTYVSSLMYSSKTGTCDSADATGNTVIWSFGVCAQGTKVSLQTGNITVTHYAAANCTGKETIGVSTGLNQCSKLGGMDILFTSMSTSLAAACNGFSPPWVIVYADDMCGVVFSASAQTSGCFTPVASGPSTQAQCKNGTAVECAFTTSMCQGEGTCKPESKDPTNTCVKTPLTGGAKKFICPADGAAPFCPALPKETTTKSNSVAAGEIGGIVAAVILIPLVIIIVVVVVLVFLKKNKASSTGGLMNKDESTTNYGSA